LPALTRNERHSVCNSRTEGAEGKFVDGKMKNPTRGSTIYSIVQINLRRGGGVYLPC